MSARMAASPIKSTASDGSSTPTQARGVTSYLRASSTRRSWTDVDVSGVMPMTAPPSSRSGRWEKRKTLWAAWSVAMPKGKGSRWASRRS